VFHFKNNNGKNELLVELINNIKTGINEDNTLSCCVYVGYGIASVTKTR
jgi:hypothetical protein